MGESIDSRGPSGQETTGGAIRLYTLTDLEPILGVTHRTLQAYVKAGRLKAVKIGGKWKVSEEILRNFVNGEN